MGVYLPLNLTESESDSDCTFVLHAPHQSSTHTLAYGKTQETIWLEKNKNVTKRSFGSLSLIQIQTEG